MRLTACLIDAGRGPVRTPGFRGRKCEASAFRASAAPRVKRWPADADNRPTGGASRPSQPQTRYEISLPNPIASWMKLGELATGLVCVVLVGAVVFAIAQFGTGPPTFSAIPPSYAAPPSSQKGRMPPRAPTSTPVDHQAMPTDQIAGWHEVFSDNFSGRSLNRANWRLYQGRPGGDPAGWFEPRHVTVSNGMLVVSAYRDPKHGDRWATGGLSSSPGLVQTYGKYLVRFRMDPGIGVGHAVVLWPANNSWPPEIDFSEDNGSGRDSTLATLHYGATDHHVASKITVDLTQWHTLGVEWLPGSLVFTLDGRDWHHLAGSTVSAVPMVLDIQTQTWPCSGTWGVCPDVRTPAVVRLDVDWVVAYAPASARLRPASTRVSSGGLSSSNRAPQGS
jgi:beta-glucanase (GH16 family)